MSRRSVLVGIDCGTTFSGSFAYAHVNDPDKVYTFHEWPDETLRGARPYCKTKTAQGLRLLYDVNAQMAPSVWESSRTGHGAGLPWFTDNTQALQRRKTGSRSFERRRQKQGPASAHRYRYQYLGEELMRLPLTRRVGTCNDRHHGLFLLTYYKVLLA